MQLNRRRVSRYDLWLSARVRLKGSQNGAWSEGQTRDISAEGVYWRAQEKIPAGSPVEMYFALPEKFTHGTKVFIHAFGRVLRVEARDDKAPDGGGMAAMIEQYDITRG